MSPVKMLIRHPTTTLGKKRRAASMTASFWISWKLGSILANDYGGGKETYYRLRKSSMHCREPQARMTMTQMVVNALLRHIELGINGTLPNTSWRAIQQTNVGIRRMAKTRKKMFSGTSSCAWKSSASVLHLVSHQAENSGRWMKMYANT